MRKKTVWVVDDDPEFLAELREALELSGYRAEAFPDAESVRQRLPDAVPDVVLLDLKMDRENGFQLAQKLKGNPRTEAIPLIAMTGHYTQREHARLIDQCGIACCIVKPLNLAEVIQRIALVTAASRRSRKIGDGLGGGARDHAARRRMPAAEEGTL